MQPTLDFAKSVVLAPQPPGPVPAPSTASQLRLPLPDPPPLWIMYPSSSPPGSSPELYNGLGSLPSSCLRPPTLRCTPHALVPLCPAGWRSSTPGSRVSRPLALLLRHHPGSLGSSSPSAHLQGHHHPRFANPGAPAVPGWYFCLHCTRVQSMAAKEQDLVFVGVRGKEPGGGRSTT